MKPTTLRGIAPARTSPKMVRPPNFSASYLLKQTALLRRNGSRDVAIQSLRKIKSPRGLDDWTTYYARVVNKTNKNVYGCHVFSPAQEITRDSKVVCGCSCQDYVFTYEVANAKRGGAAFIYRSNGEDPDVRNPALVPGLCKHLYLVLRKIVSDQP